MTRSTTPRARRLSALSGALAACAGMSVLVACSLFSTKRYGYSFTDGACATGAHTFSSKSAFCAALRDDILNRGCAPRLRASELVRSCGASAVEVPLGGPTVTPRPSPRPTVLPTVLPARLPGVAPRANPPEPGWEPLPK